MKENSVRSVEDDKGVSGGSISQTGSKKTRKEDTDNESTDGEQLSSSSHDLGYADTNINKICGGRTQVNQSMSTDDEADESTSHTDSSQNTPYDASSSSTISEVESDMWAVTVDLTPAFSKEVVTHTADILDILLNIQDIDPAKICGKVPNQPEQEYSFIVDTSQASNKHRDDVKSDGNGMYIATGVHKQYFDSDYKKMKTESNAKYLVKSSYYTHGNTKTFCRRYHELFVRDNGIFDNKQQTVHYPKRTTW